jgi:enolase-phosphatase E1
VPVSLTALGVRALVLDVEGTTTPVAFVYQVLFPFARERAGSFLERSCATPECRAALAQLRAERAAETAFDSGHVDDSDPSSNLPYIAWLMDRDRKSPGLKALQGLIWQEGFRSGELRGEVYADVPPAFERWSSGAKAIFIYSSGSVLAQQLLFGSTGAGDLTRFLTGHFDTAVGPKTAADSYRAIAQRVGMHPEDLLFVSDVRAELDAARGAGLQTALCVRSGSVNPESGGHAVITTFDDILV